MASPAPIPAAPSLASIADPATKKVLQTLIDGLNVRNGTVGDGSQKFITVADLAGATTANSPGSGGASNGLGAGSSGTGTKLGAAIDNLVQTLSDKITTSKLWNALGTRIAQIDAKSSKAASDLATTLSTVQDGVTQLNTVAANSASTLIAVKETAGQAEAGIIALNQVTTSSSSANARSLAGLQATLGANGAYFTEEQNVRATNDASLASAINTLWGSVGGSSALVQAGSSITVTNNGSVATTFTQLQAATSSAQATANSAYSLATTSNGTINGAWTVKFDINGYVAGIGLGITQGLAGAPSSSFIVRADDFAIGAVQAGATTPVASPQLPFIVQTTNWVDNTGTTQPPGVYMHQCSVTNANIGLAAIDTANIQTAAVGTLSIAGYAVTVPVYAQSYGTIPSLSVTLDEPGTIQVIVGVNTLETTASGLQSFYVGVTYVNTGVTQAMMGTTIQGSGAITTGSAFVVPAGTHTFTINTAAPSGHTLAWMYMTAIGVKR